MTILLVEDDDRVFRAVSRLAHGFGHDMLRTQSTEETLGVLERGGVDLVLADLDLGGDSGVDLLERIRARHPGVSRVLISGYDPPAEFADDPPHQIFLAKPFGRAEFASLCAAVAK